MYDAIVVGARCAGSPTAMLLARQGYRVLLVDRTHFPSDSFRNHVIRPPGVRLLQAWGLLERVLATNCPPIRQRSTNFGDFPLTGYQPAGEVPGEVAPRRKVLDKLLLDAAAEAGADVREGFAVEALLWEGGRVVGVRGREQGAAVQERARLVVGADGQHSTVARLAGAAMRHFTPALTFGYAGYWSGVPAAGIEVSIFVPQRRFVVAFPTNDGLTGVGVQGGIADFPAFRGDLEGNHLRALELVPDLAARVRAGRREERFLGSADLPNFIRQACGPGWALVGDAGAHKDPLLAQGISDAFRGAQLLADAADSGLGGGRPLEEALADYERQRDEFALPAYEEVCAAAAFSPLPPSLLRLRAALRGNQEDTDRFYGVDLGTVPREEFYAPDNLKRIFRQAGI